MIYPWWHIPVLTSPMLIALVSIVHVLISMYAVGGGIFLARENSWALKTKSRQYRIYLRKHVKFFLFVSMVLGGVTGVGVWWTIGLASPLATEQLIRIFVFGWAIEWVFFVLEIIALFIFYYCWDKLPDKIHNQIGMIYGWAAWISLVLITGITAFMLNSRGMLTDWWIDRSFWSAFFNRQFFPQVLARTGGSILLASLYLWLHINCLKQPGSFRDRIIKRVAGYSFVGIGMLLLGYIAWFIFLPPNARLSLAKAAALNIFLVLGVAILAGMLLLIVMGPFLAPKKMNLTTAIALFMFGIAAVGVSEFVREAVRKPFIVDRVVYGNQLTLPQMQITAQNGLLASGPWTRLYLAQLQEKYPQLNILPRSYGLVAPTPASLVQETEIETPDSVALTQYAQRQNRGFTPYATPSQPKTTPPGTEVAINTTSSPTYSQSMATLIDSSPRPGGEDLLRMEEADRVMTGRVIFMHHCNDCHAEKFGYSAVAPMLVGKTENEIASFARHLNRPGINMPPWSGNDVEARLLAQYLVTIRPELPNN